MMARSSVVPLTFFRRCVLCLTSRRTSRSSGIWLYSLGPPLSFRDIT